MNYRLLSRVLGMLLVLLSGAMAICLAYGYFASEQLEGYNPVETFAISFFLTFLSGLVLMLFGIKSGREMFRKEAVAVVGLGWILCAAYGALPYLFCQPHLAPVEALFESASGFTTTGATVIRDLDVFPRSILLWRSLTQWLGGLGILVLFVAALSYLGVGSKALFGHESSAKSSEGLQARIRDVAVRLWVIYLTLTAACCLGLFTLGMSFYDAVNHALTTLSTGGFSPYNESIAAFDSPWIQLWITLFMILGGISFMLYAWIMSGRIDKWRTNEEAKTYLLILLFATLIIAVDIKVFGIYETGGESLLYSVFQVVSIMTTTGYATADFDQWPPFSRVLLILLMALGGCAGSTSGSIKIGRWLLFFKITRAEILSAFRPNQIITLRLNGASVDETLRRQTVFFIALAGVVVSLGTSVISLLEPGLDMVSSFSSVTACLFNIGPGLNAVGPTQNFAHLGSATQLVLCLLMILGRLEFFAILVLFLPSLWRNY